MQYRCVARWPWCCLTLPSPPLNFTYILRNLQHPYVAKVGREECHKYMNTLHSTSVPDPYSTPFLVWILGNVSKSYLRIRIRKQHLCLPNRVTILLILYGTGHRHSGWYRTRYPLVPLPIYSTGWYWVTGRSLIPVLYALYSKCPRSMCEIWAPDQKPEYKCNAFLFFYCF